MSDAVEAQLEARNAERAALAAEIARQAPALAEIEGRLAAGRRKVAEVQQRVTAIRDERAGIEAQFQRRVGTRSQGVDEASKLVRTALAEFARASLGGAPAEFAGAVHEVRQAEEAAAKSDRVVKAHEVALASADQKKVILGIAVAAGAAVLLLVLLFFPMIYRSFAAAPPP